MRVAVIRCAAVVQVELPEGDAGEDLARDLVAAMADAAEVTRQLPTRLYCAPRAGTVAELAERARRWLVRKGCEVEVGDW